MKIFYLEDINFRNYFNITEIKESKSHEHIFIQISDIFAGITTFSRNNYTKYADWLHNHAEENLFSDMFPYEGSKNMIEKFKTLQYFREICRKNKMYVSLESSKGLKSNKPNYPINIWWYEAQGSYDKPPAKTSFKLTD